MSGSMQLVVSTFPEAATAREIALQLVEERLVACVNIIPAVESIYRWQGKVESTLEVLVVMKVTAAGYPALEKRLVALHPYDVPEVLAVPVTAGYAPYLDWVAQETE